MFKTVENDCLRAFLYMYGSGDAPTLRAWACIGARDLINLVAPIVTGRGTSS